MSLSTDVVTELVRRGLRIATAESLTAGLLAATIADVPGASATLRGGVVAYQNEVKERLLGVDPGRLASHGAVDTEVAAQMAEGARRLLGADIGVATTGVAGPELHQGHAVGTVYLGIAGLPGPAAEELHLDGDREGIRRATVQAALSSVLRRLGSGPGA